MRWALLGALVACNATPQPPVMGELAPECSPIQPVGTDDLSPRDAPLAWILVPFPLDDLDCTASSRDEDAALTPFSWLDRGLPRWEDVSLHTTTTWTRSAETCIATLRMELRGGPAGLHGSVQPCQLSALSADWASLQVAHVEAVALTVDGHRRELGWPLAWRGSLDSQRTCDAFEPVERPALGLVVVAEIAIAHADLVRLASTRDAPRLALGLRVVTW